MSYDWRRTSTSEVIRQFVGFIQHGVEHTADGKALAAEIDRRIPTPSESVPHSDLGKDLP